MIQTAPYCVPSEDPSFLSRRAPRPSLCDNRLFRPTPDSIQAPPSVRFFPPRSCFGSSSPRSLRDKDFVCSSLGEEKENRRRCSA